MSRTLILLFRRDPLSDRQTGNVELQGYNILWPDGKPVAIALDVFCKHGQRLFGLGKHLAGCEEKLVKMVSIQLSGREDNLNRIPGYRVRRFYIERTGHTGCIHFMDGTPTVAKFNVLEDDPRILYWLALDTLQDGERQWFDLAAVGLETTLPDRFASMPMLSDNHASRLSSALPGGS